MSMAFGQSDWEHLSAGGTPLCWQMLRWEPEDTLEEKDWAWLVQQAPAAFVACGPAAVSRESGEKDGLLILLCHTAFQASAYRNTAVWICGHRLFEMCGVQLEQDGTLYISETFDAPEKWAAYRETMQEAVVWWKDNAPMEPAVAHQHWLELRTIVKRRQYMALGGYVTRALRNEPEPGLACSGLVPVMIEAVWSQHPEIGVEAIIADLKLHDMARRPREAMQAWLQALARLLRTTAAPAETAPIERVIAAIEADCSLPYSQANLSRSLGVTPAYFCRLFREKTGQRFSAFLTDKRMAYARELLTLGGLPLQTVSEQCGYPNKSYFCQVFKRSTGMTPGEFEQQAAQQALQDFPDPTA